MTWFFHQRNPQKVLALASMQDLYRRLDHFREFAEALVRAPCWEQATSRWKMCLGIPFCYVNYTSQNVICIVFFGFIPTLHKVCTLRHDDEKRIRCFMELFFNYWYCNIPYKAVAKVSKRRIFWEKEVVLKSWLGEPDWPVVTKWLRDWLVTGWLTWLILAH